ncbi:pirin family protein [Pigmentibacter sp. JX0631]|uniref:pirin family protein n=1 Tax=Pigmentibacter sp. JX0631 TaxID=2976982 RepID=UPI002469B558|nr:pirin family protein [Pigmentibacter sp. JX0631]WGL59687.1 pirin family protein [Pigmentibacter sp. JX0631]
MFEIRKSKDRGSANYDWLNTKFTFSFNGYYDPKFLGFRSLKVINEDFIKGAGGFPFHEHKNMEIITYLVKGILEHKDTLGNSATISSGEVQLMSAGTGIKHSEFNHSKSDDVHLLQIWIEPNEFDQTPFYQQKNFSNTKDKFLLLASPNGERNSLIVKQDVKLYRSILFKEENVSYKLKKDRHAWIQLISGELLINDTVTLNMGDGLAITEGDILNFKGNELDNHFLIFDLQ